MLCGKTIYLTDLSEQLFVIKPIPWMVYEKRGEMGQQASLKATAAQLTTTPPSRGNPVWGQSAWRLIGKKIRHTHNERKTKVVNRTQAEKELPTYKSGHRGKNGGQEGKRKTKMMLDWMMEYGYSRVTEEAQHREPWRRRTFESALGREPEGDGL